MKRKRSKKVYFVPSKSNDIATRVLNAVPPLTGLDFRPLSDDPHKSAQEIQNIDEGVLIWGDGYTHHLSKFFDLPPGGLKRIVDNHDDYDTGWNLSMINYANHAFFSEMSGLEVQLSMTGWCLAKLDMEERFQPINSKNTRSIKDHYTEIDSSIGCDNPLQLSIDFDALEHFPSYSGWMTNSGFVLDDLVNLIEKAASTGRLERLDFGGLGAAFPMLMAIGFSGIHDIRTEPKLSNVELIDSIELVSELENYRDEVSERSLAEKILHHALHAYYRILTAYIFDSRNPADG